MRLRAPIDRHSRWAAESAICSISVPTEREPPQAVLPKTNPTTGGKESRISSAKQGLGLGALLAAGDTPGAAAGFEEAMAAAPPALDAERYAEGVAALRAGQHELGR